MKISAVVLAYNRPVSMLSTVKCLMKQTLPLHEIIVVDNGSPEPLTIPWKRVHSRIKILRVDGHTFTEAKNAGAKAATGDWLMFSYDDTLHLPDAAESLALRALKSIRKNTLYNVMVVTIPFTTRIPSERRLMKYAANTTSETIKATLRGGHNGIFLEQHCGFINRDFFWGLGGYDTRYFKSWGLWDQDLCISVIKAGGYLDSDVPRIKDGRVLLCFHRSGKDHKTSREAAAKRDEEFKAKYGCSFRADMVLDLIRQRATA